MAFYNDIRFPVNISYKSKGGPEYHTSIVTYKSGRRKRNIDWDYPLHKYEAVYGIRKQEDLEELLEFFHVVEGSGHGFRYKDWLDFKSCRTNSVPTITDQAVGTGDGATVKFQLFKTYDFYGKTKVRKITKPVAGTVIVGLDGSESTAFNLDSSTGEITFDTNTWSIVYADSASDIVAVGGDKIAFMAVGDNFVISGSTGNDGTYTVKSISYNGTEDRTEITVEDGEDITDDTADGEITHGQPNAGITITAGYEFDVPVYFDTDDLSIDLEAYRSASTSVPIVEDKFA